MEAAMQNAKEMQASKKEEVNSGDEQVHTVQQRHSRLHSPQRVSSLWEYKPHTRPLSIQRCQVFCVWKDVTLGVCAGAREVERCRLCVTRWWGRNAVGKPWEYHLHAVSTQSSDPITVDVSINGKKVGNEADTGAAVSLVSENVCKQLCASALISEVKDIFWSTTGGERSGTSGSAIRGAESIPTTPGYH